MSQIIGIDPIVSSKTTAHHDTDNDQAPILHIDHVHYTTANEVEADSKHVISGHITVKNTGKPLLQDIYVYINITHPQAEEFTKPVVCDAQGNPVPNGAALPFPAIFFGNLRSGEQSQKMDYYWTLQGGFVEDTQSFSVTPILIPLFTVNFVDYQAFNRDSTTVNIA